MGAHEGERTAPGKVLEYGDSDSGSLGGVGSRAQFVEKKQASLARLGDGYRDARHVARESA